MISSSSILLFLNSKNNTIDNRIDIYSSNDPEQSCTTCDTNIQNEEEIQGEEEQIYELKESGWIPNWAFDLGYDSLIENKGIIDTVNPVLYTINSNGDIVSRGVSDANIQRLLTYCKKIVLV